MTGPGYNPRAGSVGNPFPTARVLATAGRNRTIDAEWVLVGWREHGKCVLLASEDIDHATLRFAPNVAYAKMYRDAEDLRAIGIQAPRNVNADITAYVVIEADTFAECLAALLFGYQWKPDTIRMIRNPEAMGRNSGPSVQTQPAELCEAPFAPGGYGTNLGCELPKGHHRDGSDHSITFNWPEPAQPTIEGTPT